MAKVRGWGFPVALIAALIAGAAFRASFRAGAQAAEPLPAAEDFILVAW